MNATSDNVSPPTRAGIVAKHVVVIAEAIGDTARQYRHDQMLAEALRLHAGELFTAADLIDRPWIDAAHDLMARLNLGDRVTFRDLVIGLKYWPDFGERVAIVIESGGSEIDAEQQALDELLERTGHGGREAVLALLREVLS